MALEEFLWPIGAGCLYTRDEPVQNPAWPSSSASSVCDAGILDPPAPVLGVPERIGRPDNGVSYANGVSLIEVQCGGPVQAVVLEVFGSFEQRSIVYRWWQCRDRRAGEFLNAHVEDELVETNNTNKLGELGIRFVYVENELVEINNESKNQQPLTKCGSRGEPRKPWGGSTMVLRSL